MTCLGKPLSSNIAWVTILARESIHAVVYSRTANDWFPGRSSYTLFLNCYE